MVRHLVMKIGQITNQISRVMKTVHNFMQMALDGTIFPVVVPSIIILLNTVNLAISQQLQVIRSILLSRPTPLLQQSLM